MSMATLNFAVTTDWVQVAAAADSALLITSRDRTLVEFATTAAVEEPTGVLGHVLAMGGGTKLTRADGIVGNVWARVIAGHPDATLAVDGSSVT
jgi:hypothetical protein